MILKIFKNSKIATISFLIKHVEHRPSNKYILYKFKDFLYHQGVQIVYITWLLF